MTFDLSPLDQFLLTGQRKGGFEYLKRTGTKLQVMRLMSKAEL
jgi:hypothetical protein